MRWIRPGPRGAEADGLRTRRIVRVLEELNLDYSVLWLHNQIAVTLLVDDIAASCHFAYTS